MAYVNVDIDLSDIDEQDLIDQLESCGYLVVKKDQYGLTRNDSLSIYELLAQGRENEVINIVKDQIQAITGRILPN